MIAESQRIYHEPVMLQQVLENLMVTPGGKYIDCTLGDGGHSRALLERCSPKGKVLSIDADPDAIGFATFSLAGFPKSSSVVQSNFANLTSVARANGFIPAHGILFDFGLSSRQLEAAGRGFSFYESKQLDMRIDPSTATTADDLVNHSIEHDLANIIYEFGEEPRSRRIAKAIVESRPITTASHLAEIVRRASGYRRGRTHPATRTFQALRIAVNHELENLTLALNQVGNILGQGGRLVTITYHSLEDRIVKRFLQEPDNLKSNTHPRPLTKHVIRPTRDEIKNNHRSRSARMRVAEQIKTTGST